MSQSLIVTGATGKQGGALIANLLSRSNQPFEIYALTRKPDSPSALKLLETYPSIKIIHGDLSKAADVFVQVPNPTSLFLMSNPMNVDREEEQGKAMVKAALSAGVKHIIFTATNRGRNSDHDGTVVPHFASKFQIEKEIAKHKNTWTWTILRPVAFFENMSDDFLGRVFVGLWTLNGPEAVMKLVSTKDIGAVAVNAALDPDGEKYKNKAIDIIGDEVTLREARRIFQTVTGRQMRSTGDLTSKALKWVFHKQVGIMFDWFRERGFDADLAQMRKEYPSVMDFSTWLKNESAWRR